MKVDYFGLPLEVGDIVIYERNNEMCIVKIDSFNDKGHILYTEKFNYHRNNFYKWNSSTIITTNRIFKYTNEQHII
jgi:hypothetical protein